MPVRLTTMWSLAISSFGFLWRERGGIDIQQKSLPGLGRTRGTRERQGIGSRIGACASTRDRFKTKKFLFSIIHESASDLAM